MILAVKDLSAGYGQTPVLRKMTLSLGVGEILGVVGHNGMGKTTLLRALMGILAAAGGSIVFSGDEIASLPAHRRSNLGIGYVAQGERGFPGLTVAENLKLASLVPARTKPMSVAEAIELFPQIAGLMDRPSSVLSGGERQLLAIVRACVRAPRLLLLDELTEGVQPSRVDEIADRLRYLHKRNGTSMMIVDQELPFVASLATRVLVMQKGEVVREIRPDDLSDPHVLGGFDGN
jgi:branched-chain amino acid transport system ATP-binding protein